MFLCFSNGLKRSNISEPCLKQYEKNYLEIFSYAKYVYITL